MSSWKAVDALDGKATRKQLTIYFMTKTMVADGHC